MQRGWGPGGQGAREVGDGVWGFGDSHDSRLIWREFGYFGYKLYPDLSGNSDLRVIASVVLNQLRAVK